MSNLILHPPPPPPRSKGSHSSSARESSSAPSTCDTARESSGPSSALLPSSSAAPATFTAAKSAADNEYLGTKHTQRNKYHFRRKVEQVAQKPLARWRTQRRRRRRGQGGRRQARILERLDAFVGRAATRQARTLGFRTPLEPTVASNAKARVTLTLDERGFGFFSRR